MKKDKDGFLLGPDGKPVTLAGFPLKIVDKPPTIKFELTYWSPMAFAKLLGLNTDGASVEPRPGQRPIKEPSDN